MSEIKRKKMIEVIDDLPEDQRREIASKLAETTLDFMGAEAGSKVADVAPDTKLTIPPEVAEKDHVTTEDLMQIPWSRNWGYEMAGMVYGSEEWGEMSEEEREKIVRGLIERKLLPEIEE